MGSSVLSIACEGENIKGAHLTKYFSKYPTTPTITTNIKA